MKSVSQGQALALALGALITMSSATSLAIPAFARKEQVGCTTCHTAIPKLTRTGYEFRSAGFRMPEKIGVDQSPKDLGDTMDFRGNFAASYSQKQQTGGNVTTLTETETGGSLYALAGSFGTNFGALTEIALASGQSTANSSTAQPQVGVTDLQLRAVFGQADSHYNFRAGMLPLTNGYGASDRSLASSQTISPIVGQNGGSWGNSGIGTSVTTSPGLEVGYTWFGSEIAVASVNGLVYDPVDKKLHAYGNGFASRSALDPNYNNRDVFVRANQFIGKKHAVSGYYYSGSVSLPNAHGDTADGTYADGKFSTDNFSRYALYGTYWATDELTLMAGYLGGEDTFASYDVVNSGGFLAADYYLGELTAVGGRYDMGMANSDSTYNQWQADLYYTYFWKPGLYASVHLTDSEVGTGPSTPTTITQTVGLSGTYIW
jgi:hypothetical protein